MAQSVAYAIDVQAHDGAGVVDLHYGAPGWTTRPTDTPAHTTFLSRVQSAGNFSLQAFAAGRTGGRSTVGYGRITLVNSDGGLDDLARYGWGRRITVRRGLVDGQTFPAFPAAWDIVFAGIVEQAEVSRDLVALLIRDRQAEIADKPLSVVKFAGNNILPSGVEGVAADLKGKVKPWLYGPAENFPAPCCNTSRLVFQVSQGAIASISAVYDRGATITAGTARASLALLLANTPAAGTFDWYLGASGDGAYIRLGTTPTGEITVTATEGATSADRTAAQVIKRILLGPGGLTTGDIDAAAITALDAANDAEIGFWVGDETTIGDILDRICTSVGAFWGFTRDGKFTVSRLELPSGPSVDTYTASDFGADIDRVAGRDPGAGKGVWQVVLSYRPNHTVQTSDLAGSVSQARRAVIAKPYATVTANDNTVLTQYPLADQIKLDTVLAVEADAQAEADRLQAMYAAPLDFVDLTLAASRAGTIDIGQVVTIRYERFGWGAGKQFRVLGRTEDHEGSATVKLSLVG